MPKSKYHIKKKTRAVKVSSVKLSKDLIIGIAIGAIVIFVFCLMKFPDI